MIWETKDAILAIKSIENQNRGDKLDYLLNLFTAKQEVKKYKRDSKEWKYWTTEVRRSRKYYNATPKQIEYEVKISLKGWSKFSWTYFVTITKDKDYILELKRVLKEYTDNAKRKFRSTLKISKFSETWFNESVLFYGKKGTPRVFVESDQVLKIYIRKNMDSLYKDKKPEGSGNYLGVEIEFCAPISEEKLALKLFRSGVHRFTQLKRDNSLRPLEGETAFELAMLFRENNYKKDLKQITTILSEIKAVAQDRRCGLHIHFDMRHRNKETVFSNLVSCQNVLLSIVDPRRINNEFCRMVHSKKFPTTFTGSRDERYKTINAASYYRHKTLEVRMHEGSIDFDSMVLWIDLLLKIVNCKKKLKGNISKLLIFKKRLAIPEKMYKVALDKSCYWQINQPRERANFEAIISRSTEERSQESGLRASGIASAAGSIFSGEVNPFADVVANPAIQGIAQAPTRSPQRGVPVPRIEFTEVPANETTGNFEDPIAGSDDDN